MPCWKISGSSFQRYKRPNLEEVAGLEGQISVAGGERNPTKGGDPSHPYLYHKCVPAPYHSMQRDK